MKFGIIGRAEDAARAERALVESGQRVACVADPSSEPVSDLLAESPWIHQPAGTGALGPSVEAVAIATPDLALRAPLATEALRRGRHVLVMGTSGCDARGAERLEALARAHERGLLAAAPDPHGEVGARLLALARELEPIRLVTMRRRLDRAEQPAILDLLAGDLALLHALGCAPPDWVSASALRERAEGPVLGFSLTLQHRCGALAQIEIELGAERAGFSLTARDGERRIALRADAGEPPSLTLDGEPVRAGRARASGLADLAARFAAGVDGPGEPLVDARVPQVRVLEALRASLLRGGRAVEPGAAAAGAPRALAAL
jgi:predicted dehydrogenase